MSGPRLLRIILIATSILVVCICIHLIGVYMYVGGHYEGVKGGSISIGIVDTPPNAMNPFQYGHNSSTDLMYRFLLRGMIRYDIASGIYKGDLGNCDLSNITLVTCTLRDDAVWSDSTRIKIEDIIATIDTFRHSAPNGDMRTFLEGVTIKKNGDTIEIRSNSKNQLMIELLTYPIVKSDTIKAIRENTINAKNYVTSGPYRFGESVTDTEYGFDRITLVRNEKWIQTTWLDKINFKFFKDLSSLERSVEALTIVIPPIKNEKLDIGPRFKEYLYTNYEYFGVFFNTKSISRSLRNILHWQIGTSFDKNIAPDHKRRDTIFLSGGALLPTDTLRGFSDILRELGYTKKNEILSKIEQSSTTLSGEPVFDTAKYWNTKSGMTTIFVGDSKSEIVLTGKVPPNTLSVNINGYTLREFAPGNTTFVYKVTALSGTLTEGKNTYTLTVGFLGNKTDTETLTLYASDTPATLEGYKKELKDTYNATQNTVALIAERERKKEELLEQARSLGDEYYYDSKSAIFSIRIGYVTGPQSTEPYARQIDAALRLLGVKTELIAYGPKEIQQMITTGDRKYDLLVIGISVEGSLSHIGQLFSSKESGSGGINFSNVENKALDSLFADLQATTDANKLVKIQQDISRIINTESFFVPISSPYHRIWVDRNIKGIPPVDIMPDIAGLTDVFVGTSIKENYIKNLSDKSISGWWKWLWSKL